MKHGRRQFVFAALIATGALLGPSAALAAGIVDQSRQVIEGMSSQVLSTLKNQGQSRAQREQRFAQIFRSHFDVPTIGRWVMGTAWSQANPGQRTQLMQLFQAYIIKTYTIQLSKYTGEQFKVVSASPDGPGAVVVSHIVGGGSPVVLKWRMRRAGSTVKVRDVVIDNISMSLNQRREFTSVYRARGNSVDGLITAMRQKVAQLDRQ